MLLHGFPLLLHMYHRDDFYLHPCAGRHTYTRCRLRLSTHALLLQPSLLHSYYTSFRVSLLSESIPLPLYAYNYIDTRCKFHFPNCALLLQLLLDYSSSTSFHVSFRSESIPLFLYDYLNQLFHMAACKLCRLPFQYRSQFLLYAYKYIHTRCKFHFSNHALFLQPSLLHIYYTSFRVSLQSESISLLLHDYLNQLLHMAACKYHR